MNGLRCGSRGARLRLAPFVITLAIGSTLAGHVAADTTVIITGLPSDGCIGDCNDDGVVTVNELVAGVNIALGTAPASTCPAFDDNGDGGVSISELIAGVNNLLYGCNVTPPTAAPTASATATPSESPTAASTDTATPPPVATASDTPTPSPTRTVKPTKTATRTPTQAVSVCGGFVSTLPVVCNLSVIPNPVSRSGTISFRFGVSDLDGDINGICLALTHPPLEPQTSCSSLTPTNKVINAIQTTVPISASPLAFGAYNAAVQAFDKAGHSSNIATAAFQVQ
jgi:hypothetical protein